MRGERERDKGLSLLSVKGRRGGKGEGTHCPLKQSMA